VENPSEGTISPARPGIPLHPARTLASTVVINYQYECAASLKRSGRDAADRLTSVNGVAYTWDDNPLRCASGTTPPRVAAGTTRQLDKRRGAQLHL
jgi:hypothetical protein